MAANHELIFLKPIFHEKIWGGRKLDTDWGYSIPDGPIGECWAISAHPHGDCRLTAAPLTACASPSYGHITASSLAAFPPQRAQTRSSRCW